MSKKIPQVDRRKPVPAFTQDLTRQQAAAALNCGLAKIDELVRTNVLEGYKLAPGQRGGRRITARSIEALRRGRPVETLKTDDPDSWTPPEVSS